TSSRNDAEEAEAAEMVRMREEKKSGREEGEEAGAGAGAEASLFSLQALQVVGGAGALLCPASIGFSSGSKPGHRKKKRERQVDASLMGMKKENARVSG
ncbi:hypothetical protein M440DRAFT_1401374, partial [Trichoderma longibrachiatum ATCC 18648]